MEKKRKKKIAPSMINCLTTTDTSCINRKRTW
jgi:hypothetical protein